jgi:mannose-1-phosphate guanylyltransferase
MSVFAVILAGGRGERFWPESRRLNPKQFLKITGEVSLLETTVGRMRSDIPVENLLVVTTRDLGARIRELLPDLPEANVLLEPMGRNTAVALAYAASVIEQRDPDATMAVLPSDHDIPDTRKFLRTLEIAEKVAETGFLVTFGIVPVRPETGYGYVEFSDEVLSKGEIPVYRASAFKEKPNLKLARSFVTSGRHLWNSGMFVWKVGTIMEAFRKHMPALYDGMSHLKKALSRKAHEKEVKEFYDRAESISIDYGIMERAENVAVVRADFKWDDVGSWTALERLRARDETGSVAVGDFVGIDTKDCIVYSRSGLVGTIGIDNLIIIRTKDATLICKKERAQDVRALVSLLSERKLEEYL